MTNLLHEEFYRLSKNSFYIISCIVSFFIATSPTIMRYINGQTAAYYTPQYTELIFYCNLLLTFAMAAFIGLFIGTEFSESTIRNKLILGHKRSHVYMTEFIVCAIGNMVISTISISSVLLVGNLLIGPPNISMASILVCFFLSLLTDIAFSALLVFVTMLIANKATGSVICLLLITALLFASVFISTKLAEPEMYEAYVFIDSDTDELIYVDAEANPNYVSGIKREALELTLNVLPSGQYLALAAIDLDNSQEFVFYDIVWSVVFVGAGLALFHKKDLQ